MKNEKSEFELIAEEIGKLVTEKNKAYGNAFFECSEFLKLLYPNGINPENYGDMLFVCRVFDKLKRIATNKNAFSEDPYKDIIGYGLLATHNNKKRKE